MPKYLDYDGLKEYTNKLKIVLQNMDSVDNSNLVNGGGSSSLNQVQDGTTGTFDFTNKNPNATAIDSTLTGQIAYGGQGAFATSFGGKSSAQGKRSFACGTTTIAKGAYSFASGDNSVALGVGSFASGARTVAADIYSHSEGQDTQATGQTSHAEGEQTIARHRNSHAEGFRTQTGRTYQHVSGECNVGKSNTFFEVGNGTSDTDRKNAFEVLQDGRAKVQSAPTEDDDVVRKADLPKIYRHDIYFTVTSYVNVYSVNNSKQSSIPTGFPTSYYATFYSDSPTGYGTQALPVTYLPICGGEPSYAIFNGGVYVAGNYFGDIIAGVVTGRTWLSPNAFYTAYFTNINYFSDTVTEL